jgi:transcriptional regulator with XRE-family HTH domain
MRTLYQKQKIREVDLAVLAGCSVSTVKNMFGGKTRRPQHLTFCKLAGAMGKEYALRDKREVDYKAEIPVAREQYKAHKERLRKQREAAEKRTRK